MMTTMTMKMMMTAMLDGTNSDDDGGDSDDIYVQRITAELMART